MTHTQAIAITTQNTSNYRNTTDTITKEEYNNKTK